MSDRSLSLAISPRAMPCVLRDISAEICSNAMRVQMQARRRQIEILLAGAAMPTLDYAEGVSEWIVINDALAAVYAQPDQKPKGGRPRGGVAEAARRIPLPKYMSECARRQHVQRMLRISRILPRAKAEARAQELDDNQTALMAIAAEKTEDAQVKVARTWRFRNASCGAATPVAETYSLSVPESLDARRRQKLERIMKLVASSLRVPVMHVNAPKTADADERRQRPTTIIT